MSDEPRFTPADLAYIKAGYRTLDDLCGRRNETPDQVRALIAQGWMPRPSYILPDGTEMFPPDYFELPDAAGDVDSLPGYFAARYRAAAAVTGITADDTGATWEDYLSGLFGVCLRQVSTEAMALKARLMDDIERLTSAPARDDPGWRTALRSAVDALDQLERPFTDYDRAHRGVPSRDTHINDVRRRNPQVFAAGPTELYAGCGGSRGGAGGGDGSGITTRSPGRENAVAHGRCVEARRPSPPPGQDTAQLPATPARPG